MSSISMLLPESQILTTAEDLQVEIVRNWKEFALLQSEWDSLFNHSPSAAPPMCYSWLQVWWNLYGVRYALRKSNDDGLRILLARHNGQLVGAFPLYIGQEFRYPMAPRRLCFLGSGEAEQEEICSERLDMLYLEGMGNICLQAFWKALVREEDWDLMELRYVPESSPLHSNQAGDSALEEMLSELSEPILSYKIDCEGGTPEILKKYTHDPRKKVRKLLEAFHTQQLEFRIAQSPSEVCTLLDELEAMHQSRWNSLGQSGSFAAPVFKEFHKEVLLALIPTGLGAICGVYKDGTPYGMILGYSSGNRFHHYISGTFTSEDSPLKSPGIACQMLLIDHLIQRGITIYDYLGGDARFKREFSHASEAMYHRILRRTTTRNRLLTTLRAIKRSIRPTAAKPVESSQAQ